MPSSQLNIAQLMHNAGFPDSAIPKGVAIVQAESGGNPAATNHNTNGSTDYGLWQINSVHSSLLSHGVWNDPQSNTNMAYQVWKSAGGSWSPWSTYNSGAYQKYMAFRAPNPPIAGNGTGTPIGPIWPRIFGSWGNSGNSGSGLPAPAGPTIAPAAPNGASGPAGVGNTGSGSSAVPGNGNSTLGSWLPKHFMIRFLWFLLGLLLVIGGTIILFRRPIMSAAKDATKAAAAAAI